MGTWLRNVYVAVSTVIYGMWVTIWTMSKTYRRKAFTAVYEYFFAADMQHDRIVGGAGIDVAFVDVGEAGVWSVEYVFYV